MMRFSLAGGRCELLCTLGAFPAITASCHFDIKHGKCLYLTAYLACSCVPTFPEIKNKIEKCSTSAVHISEGAGRHVGSLALQYVTSVRLKGVASPLNTFMMTRLTVRMKDLAGAQVESEQNEIAYTPL